MKKIDYKKDLKHLYKPSPKQVEIFDVPEMNFLMVDGKGDPNTAKEYSDGVQALYGVAYALKFMIKKGEPGINYGVMPLEALWWADDMTQFDPEDKSKWLWTAMIMQPEPVSRELFMAALEQVRKKKNPAALAKVRFAAYGEATAAQILHVGPFSDEGPTIERVHEFIRDNGYERAGKHHGIYLSDIRRAAPENWQTVIRQPVVKT